MEHNNRLSPKTFLTTNLADTSLVFKRILLPSWWWLILSLNLSFLEGTLPFTVNPIWYFCISSFHRDVESRADHVCLPKVRQSEVNLDSLS